MSSLYSISQDFSDLMLKLESEEISPEEANSLGNELAEALQNKSTSCVGYIVNLEASEKIVADEIARLTELKKNLAKKKDRFKEYVLNCMKMLQLDNISTPIGNITRRKCPTSVEVYDESMLDDEYKRIEMKTSPDKTKIKKALENNEEVQGARLITDKENIQVK